MSDEPQAQLYARVPVRWEKHEESGTDYLVGNFRPCQLGYAIMNNDDTWSAYADGEELGDMHPTQADARRAVKEYWNVTTEDPS